MIRSLGSAAVAALLLAAPPAGVAAASPHTGPAKTKPDQKPGGKAPKAHGAAAHQAGTAHGIVQSVGAEAVVVRELDGSTVSIPVAASTRVFVDGRRASLRDVGPGFVASASWKAAKAAAELQSFDPSASVAVVQSVSAHAVVVTDGAGSTITIRVTPKTRVLVDGKPTSIGAVEAGDSLVMNGGKPASELRFLRPG